MLVAADELLFVEGDVTEVLAKLKDNKWYPVDQDDSPGYKNLIIYTDIMGKL